MNAVRFLDTNIFLYAHDIDSSKKKTIAGRYLAEGWDSPGGYVISMQVLHELFANLRKRLSAQEAATVVADFDTWIVIENTKEIFRAGIREHERWQVSFWDGLILAAARAAGATELISEDFSHGQNYGGIVAINPFR